MPPTRSRYDGHAEWYDGWNRPHAERNAPDVRELLGPGDGLCLDLGCGSGLYFDVLAHPAYRQAGWHQEAPWWGPYVRKRVGMRHHPLAELLNAFISAGLVIEHVAKPGDRPVPVNLAIRARKPRAQPG